jgi:hypothetical protein
MKHQQSRLVTQIVCYLIAAICLFMLLTHTVAAQRSSKPPGGPNLKGDMQQRGVRESVLRSNGSIMPNRKVDAKRLEATIEKVKEDFKQIQILRNEMVRNILANKPMDYKLIADETAEIHKRTNQLKSYLIPEIPEDKEKKKNVEFNPEQMKGALVQLCNLIASFVDNPILKNPELTDVEQSAKAGGELLNIIALSGTLKRNAERLHKIFK